MENVLRNIIKDKAVLSERSMEEIVVEILEEDLLPAHSSVKDIILRNLYAHQGVGHTVSAIFQVTSGGMEWKAKHSNLRPLVQFCLENQKNNFRLTNSEAGYLKSNLKLLLEHLSDKKALELNDTVDLLEEGVSEVNAKNLYQILLRNWAELKSWSVTYRTLYGVTSASGTWSEDEKTRMRLLKILKEISEEWESQDIQG
jgi:hypothetical protein